MQKLIDNNNSFTKASKCTVSIIMPTYQRASIIMESVRSVLEQSFEGYELLIIDDGSTDTTRELIENVKDSRIKYFFLEHSGNLAYLRNFGILHSKGEFIAFIDSDDLWQREKLEKQITILNNNSDVGITFSHVEEFNKDGVLKKGLYNPFKSHEVFFQGNIFYFLITMQMVIYSSSVMFRKKCLEKTGFFDENLKTGDSNFLIRFSFLFNAYVLFDYLTRIRKHDENFSTKENQLAYNEMLETIKSFYNSGNITSKIFNKSLLRLHYNSALDFSRRNNLEESRRELLICLKINPFFIKPALRYILSYFK